MAQAGLFTAEVRVPPRSVHAVFVVETATLGQFFLRVLRFSLVTIIQLGIHNSALSGDEQ
jgi:hypothetical protein